MECINAAAERLGKGTDGQQHKKTTAPRSKEQWLESRQIKGPLSLPQAPVQSGDCLTWRCVWGGRLESWQEIAMRQFYCQSQLA